MIKASFCIAALLLSGAFAAPAAQASSKTSSVAAFDPTETVAPISIDRNVIMWNASDAGDSPQPIRGTLGTEILGPTDDYITKENPDLLAPPTTDSGFNDNAKWPFSLSKTRLSTGGWSRQQNAAVMPFATKMAAVNMRLSAGSIRELHWHTTPEWAYVIKGTTQISAVDQNGQNYLASVEAGDLWYFPPGVPHSLQATADDPEGSEFLLIFPNSDFSDDSTFLLTDWLAHTPVDVLAKNFQVDPSAFAHIPSEQLYIFPGTPPAEGNSSLPVGPKGTMVNPLSLAWSKVEPVKVTGGTVKIVDSRSFAVSTSIAAASVTVEPGAIRELHWHPTQDEWGYFLEGEGRITIFASKSVAGTFNYVAGDVSYIPAGMGHYIENTGNTTLRFLEVFNADKYEDISLSTWLALTPPDLVKAHLGFDNETMSHLFKNVQVVIGPDTKDTSIKSPW